MSIEQFEVVFGSPGFAREIYAAYSAQFDAISNLEILMNDLFRFSDDGAREPSQAVVCLLVRVTGELLNDVLLLAGHGRGIAAIIITRSMFERTVTAEYLRRNPGDAEDFRQYGHIQKWNRYQELSKSSPEKAKEIAPETVTKWEADYRSVVSRFTGKGGKVRKQWHKKRISEMARDIDRLKQYETPYSLAASFHHGNFEGVTAYFDHGSLRVSPSHCWVKQALESAHCYLLQALDTLNESLHAGSDEGIRAAEEEFKRVWTIK